MEGQFLYWHLKLPAVISGGSRGLWPERFAEALLTVT
jgi:hypothetical protein